MKKLILLKKYFGYETFRPLQEEAIDAVLANRDLLMILPTGGGKSLCYQLPTLMMSGVTVIISPLLALMHDQVVALKSNGITAEMLSSMQSQEESQQIEKRLKKNLIKLLYVATERVTNPYFLDLLNQLNINFFVIDEAHCVSEWGHEFRENYRQLYLLKEHFPSIPIAAFTATATLGVEKDIIEQLRLAHPLDLRGIIFRSNLIIRARHRINDGRLQLLEFLKLHKNEAGIIYTLSRKSTESIAGYLQTKGYEAQPYHAKLTTQEKNKIYADFVADRIDIVVATIAFGMGIDKSNIRFVVHMNMPKTIESYYQEIGRAGRDGLEAETLLLFSAKDTMQQRLFIDPLEETPYKLHSYNKLETIARFVNSQECRHQTIAHYFGDQIKACKNSCDNCLESDVKNIDITTASRKLLSAIFRTKQKFGLHYVVDVLRGSQERRIIANNHDRLSVYKIGLEHTKEQWLTIGDRLFEIGALKATEFKTAILSNFGAEILKGTHKIELHEDRLFVQKSLGKKIEHVATQEYDADIYSQLKTLRKDIAQTNNIPPYMVFSDKTLKELAHHRPKTKNEMLQIHGIGEIKFQRYGDEFLSLINET